MTLAVSSLRRPPLPAAGAAADASGRFDSRPVEVGDQLVAALRRSLRTTPELTAPERATWPS